MSNYQSRVAADIYKKLEAPTIAINHVMVELNDSIIHLQTDLKNSNFFKDNYNSDPEMNEHFRLLLHPRQILQDSIEMINQDIC